MESNYNYVQYVTVCWFFSICHNIYFYVLDFIITEVILQEVVISVRLEVNSEVVHKNGHILAVL